VNLCVNMVSLAGAKSQIQEVAQMVKVLIGEDMPKSISRGRGAEAHDVDGVRHVHVQSGAAVVGIIADGSQRCINLRTFFEVEYQVIIKAASVTQKRTKIWPY
jgi:hypothetical protein